ncbi:MAG TPA: cytochrome c biogenesis protein ResB, partial [Candidatus Wallbacteria bacterium]|nr:cytochrome c biogenesis protein ResB [Candidatus Wallbacteria bacterium]
MFPLKNNAFIKFFSSITTAITLLFIIALSSVAGTLIQQNQEFIFYKKNFPQYYGWIYFFSLDDLYHSAWFVALIVLLCVNIIVCTLRRFNSRLQAAQTVDFDITADFIATCRFKKSIEKVSNESAAAVISAKIKEFGYALYVKETDGRACFFGNCGAYSFLGEFTVHASLLMIIAGALIGNIYGYKTQM